MIISVSTPYRHVYLVKIAFATVSGVLSEMPTNSAYFENALVKLKMYLLLLLEATGAAIMSKCTCWWVFKQTDEGVSRLGGGGGWEGLAKFGLLTKKVCNVLVQTRPLVLLGEVESGLDYSFMTKSWRLHVTLRLLESDFEGSQHRLGLVLLWFEFWHTDGHLW